MENILVSDLMQMDIPNHLEHYGVLGMHWGVRRFQPYSLIPRRSGKGGKETGAAKKASKGSVKSTVAKISDSVVKKKSRKEKQQEVRDKYEQQAKTARQRREELERLVNSGDAKAIYEHKSELSEQQLKAAISRIQTEAQLKSLVAQQNPSKAKRIKDKIDEATDYVRTGTNAYKAVSDVAKIAKDLKSNADNRERDAISSEEFKRLMENGSAADVAKVATKLTDNDLKRAKERFQNLKDLDSVARDNLKNQDFYEKRAKDEAGKQRKYLKDSLKEIESGRERSEEWIKDIQPKVKTTERKTETARDVLKKDAATFNVKTTKKSDRYFDNEVERTTGQNVRKTSGKARGIKGQKWVKKSKSN